MSALPPSEVSAIRAAEKALAASFDSPDPAAWVDFYTDDAIFIGPGSRALEGRSELLEVAPRIRMSGVEITTESILGAGDFAATVGRGSWVGGDGGADAPRVRRRFLMVWRRESDGRWRIARELLTDDV